MTTRRNHKIRGCILACYGDGDHEASVTYCATHAAAPDLLAALEQIAKGEGSFNRDPLKHAENVIEEAKATARDAIRKAKP